MPRPLRDCCAQCITLLLAVSLRCVVSAAATDPGVAVALGSGVVLQMKPLVVPLHCAPPSSGTRKRRARQVVHVLSFSATKSSFLTSCRLFG